ncbi:hypothetical protein JHK87_027184 [Glycine soja]|nr:hypothetical protein JHK87_027184 [Glycine soja]
MSAGLQITGWPAHDSSISSILFGPDETSIFSLGSDGKANELYLLFEQFCDHFHATSRNSMYMNFISSHSNNIHALEQLRSIKDKASSSAQADKAIAEIEAKCGQKIEECKEEQRQ